jgi:phage FluMu protein Com
MKTIYRKKKPPLKELEKGEVNRGLFQVHNQKIPTSHSRVSFPGVSPNSMMTESELKKKILLPWSPFRNTKPAPRPFMRCGKCNHVMPESMVTDHLIECQPTGVECSKCNKFFKPQEFLEHFKQCEGKSTELKFTGKTETVPNESNESKE